MKKMFLLLMMAWMVMDVCAKPVLHVEGSMNVSVGRKKYDCKRIWLCFSDATIDVKLESGMITSGNNGLVLEDDGSLSIAINQDNIRVQDPSKYKELSSGSIILDSEDTLPQSWLTLLGYKGSNIFQAGSYRVTVYQGYFLIHL